MFFHFKKNKKDAVAVLLFFLFTGVMIIIYLNITPYQPRERDYAYVGSYYAFAIWIGLGVLGIIDYLTERRRLTFKNKTMSWIITIVCSLIYLGIMKDGLGFSIEGALLFLPIAFVFNILRTEHFGLGLIKNKKLATIISVVTCLISVPFLMAAKNWDDHDRSNRYTAKEVAANYLNS